MQANPCFSTWAPVVSELFMLGPTQCSSSILFVSLLSTIFFVKLNWVCLTWSPLSSCQEHLLRAHNRESCFSHKTIISDNDNPWSETHRTFTAATVRGRLWLRLSFQLVSQTLIPFPFTFVPICSNVHSSFRARSVDPQRTLRTFPPNGQPQRPLLS